MKEKILQILSRSSSTISGESISKSLGTSRVAVWKNIQKLKKDGHDIESTPKGYCLVNPEDLLHPWNFTQFENQIHYFATTESTMAEARKLSNNGCPDFSVVIADEQTKGKGRLDRVWNSQRGGVYFTVIIKRDISPVLSFRVNFAASLVLARLLIDEYKIDASVKWPNDILVGDKKLCGILSEMESSGEIISYIGIGMGINVNNAPAGDGINAVSIKSLIGKTVSRRALLEKFLHEFHRKIAHIEDTEIIAEWKNFTSTIGKRVSIETVKSKINGVAIDVDSTGALIVEKDDGVCEQVLFGDCFYL